MKKVICFDFDDTLFDYAATERVALKFVFDELDIPFNNLYIGMFKDINRKIWNESERDRRLDKNLLRFERFKILFQKLEINNPDELAKEASMIYIKKSEKGILIDGVETTIKYLNQKGYTLLIASSGLSNPRLQKLQDSPIKNCFYKSLFRENFKEEDIKPRRGFFDQIAYLSKLERKDMLFVGNNFYDDIKGAKEAGFATVWFNYFNIPEREVDTETYCDYIIYNFEDLINKVEDWDNA